MKNLIDTHMHTLVCGHAYSTMQENIQVASEKSLKYCGLSEHTRMMPGSVGDFYFSNMNVIPRMINGVIILRGAEANILNTEGEIDLEEQSLGVLDYVIASLHSPCYTNKHTLDENMEAYRNTCKNHKVTVIGHPDDGRYLCDYEMFVDICKETDTLIEINNSSLRPGGFRKNCWENSSKILKLCKEKNHPVILNSDAHICTDVGNIDYAEKLIEECGFPKELVVNYNESLIQKYFLKNFE